MMDRQALLQAFPAHRSKLVAALSRLVGDADAEDLTDDTLLKAVAALDGFREEAALGTWLHRIAINLAYDHLRRQGRQPVEFMEPEMLPDVADEGPDRDEQRQMSACVQQVLETLPAAQRQLLLQADVLELTAAEIAEETNVSAGNAKIRLHRARRALEAELSSRCDFHHREDGILCCAPKRDIQVVSISSSRQSKAGTEPPSGMHGKRRGRMSLPVATQAEETHLTDPAGR